MRRSPRRPQPRSDHRDNTDRAKETPEWQHRSAKPILVRLEALPGREDDVRGFLNQGLSIVGGRRKTVRCLRIQFGPSSFGIFDAFPDEDGHQAHLSGEVAKALGEKTGVLFEKPTIEQLDVVAEKQPA